MMVVLSTIQVFSDEAVPSCKGRGLNMKSLRFWKTQEVRVEAIILLSAAFFTFFCNVAFFDNVIRQYSLQDGNFFFVLSLMAFLYVVTVLLLSLFCFCKTVKPVLAVLFPLAALASYFMNTYNIVVDTTMVTNVLATDSHEAFDLVHPKMLFYVIVLGILPAWWVSRLKITQAGFRKTVVARVQFLAGIVSVVVVLVLTEGQHYASFFREHKVLRYYANPVTAVYSIGKYASEHLQQPGTSERLIVGEDARIPATDLDRELIIMVLGETARADHFSLNGYARQTNPLLETYPVINLPNMLSCATSTAISLPCMFSLEQESGFDADDSRHVENLLDVLSYANVDILWRDNNSDSKGVAVNVLEEDFRTPEKNPLCDEECRDPGMLAGLEEYIQGTSEGDVLIVLHQMGNHGPAYHKRYPEAFEVFTPVCDTNELNECSTDEINNAYDNAILYTDYFLAQVIEFLKNYDDEFETAMFYVSDHGESLGEHGMYLHGMPNFIAPEEQRHVPAILWFGDNYHIDRQQLLARSGSSYSHDNVFHTVLGMMEIQTSIYDPALDILNGAHLP
jgi:lipid A ethanolaminephosphotransferase